MTMNVKMRIASSIVPWNEAVHSLNKWSHQYPPALIASRLIWCFIIKFSYIIYLWLDGYDACVTVQSLHEIMFVHHHVRPMWSVHSKHFYHTVLWRFWQLCLPRLDSPNLRWMSPAGLQGHRSIDLPSSDVQTGLQRHKGMSSPAARQTQGAQTCLQRRSQCRQHSCKQPEELLLPVDRKERNIIMLEWEQGDQRIARCKDVTSLQGTSSLPNFAKYIYREPCDKNLEWATSHSRFHLVTKVGESSSSSKAANLPDRVVCSDAVVAPSMYVDTHQIHSELCGWSLYRQERW